MVQDKRVFSLLLMQLLVGLGLSVQRSSFSQVRIGYSAILSGSRGRCDERRKSVSPTRHTLPQ